MWREKVLESHLVVAGLVMDPGPFKGQRLYVPYFWWRYMMGEADEVDDGCPFFRVTADEYREFPELGHRRGLRLKVEGNRILEA